MDLKLYFNGELVASGSTTNAPLSPSRGEPVYIGRLVQPFAGMIDEVKLYPFSLPEEYFQNSYANTIDGLSDISQFIPTAFSGGDELSCEVIPNDSYADGTSDVSESVLH